MVRIFRKIFSYFSFSIGGTNTIRCREIPTSFPRHFAFLINLIAAKTLAATVITVQGLPLVGRYRPPPCRFFPSFLLFCMAMILLDFPYLSIRHLHTNFLGFKPLKSFDNSHYSKLPLKVLSKSLIIEKIEWHSLGLSLELETQRITLFHQRKLFF